ncbi:MAG: hypothetical protein P8P91_03930 [Pseudomonadales bacterium]|mgnify:FL=1|nr:hypothetical protein [Pseudomonadales bacterium]
MKIALGTLWLCLSMGALAEKMNWERAQFHYRMFCQGCHSPDGGGATSVPPLKDNIGYFLEIPAGREYLVRVPGSATSALNDGNLAEVLNWIISEFSGDSAGENYERYTASEISRVRVHPLDEVEHYRTKLLAQIAAAKARN